MNSGTNNLCIYSMTTGALRATLTGHTSDVHSLELINSKLVSGSLDNNIFVWDTHTFTVLSSFKSVNNVNSLQALSNGLLAAGIGSNINIYDPTSLNSGALYSLTGHSGTIRCMIVLPNDDLVSGSLDMSIKIWNTTTYTLKSTISNAHAGEVYCLKYITDNVFASGSNRDQFVKLWFINNHSNIESILTNNDNFAIETLSKKHLFFNIEKLGFLVFVVLYCKNII